MLLQLIGDGDERYYENMDGKKFGIKVLVEGNVAEADEDDEDFI